MEYQSNQKNQFCLSNKVFIYFALIIIFLAVAIIIASIFDLYYASNIKKSNVSNANKNLGTSIALFILSLFLIALACWTIYIWNTLGININKARRLEQTLGGIQVQQQLSPSFSPSPLPLVSSQSLSPSFSPSSSQQAYSQYYPNKYQ